jgi:hypothetical protein
MRVATQERTFEFALSDTRLAEIAREIGEMLKQAKELEEQLAAAKEQAKGIPKLMQTVRTLGIVIDRGTEERAVTCEWRYDDPSEGLKSLYRTDDGTLVQDSTGEMSDEEKQGELFVGEGGALGDGSDKADPSKSQGKDEMHNDDLVIPPAPPEE